MTKFQILLFAVTLFQPFPVLFYSTKVIGVEAPIIHDYPVFDIDVKQDGRTVRFEFYRKSGSAQVNKRTPQDEVHIISVHLRGHSGFWQIMAKPSVKGIQSVTYGIVPPGFVQVVPKTGLAPTLEENVEYYVSATGGGRGIATYSKDMVRKSK